jgi:hypothetical protein
MSGMKNPENDINFSERRHPVDFIEPATDNEPLALASEIIARVFLLAAEGKTLDECGFRAIVALHCVRPDLYSGATLEQIGLRAGKQRQAVWKMQEDFRRCMGI